MSVTGKFIEKTDNFLVGAAEQVAHPLVRKFERENNFCQTTTMEPPQCIAIATVTVIIKIGFAPKSEQSVSTSPYV